MVDHYSTIRFRLIAFLFFFSAAVSAQEAPYGSLGLRRIYQSTLINPALVPDATSVESSLGFVVDAGVTGEAGAFNLGTLTSSIQDGNLNLNMLVDKMNDSKSSLLFAGANSSLFHIYLNVGKKGSKLEISQRVKASGSTNMVNKNLFGAFINDDNETNRLVDLTDSKMQAMTWNELAVGYTTKIKDKWTVGVKAKYLTGVAYADFSSKKFTGRIGPDGNSFDINSELRTATLNPISNEAFNQDLTPYKTDDYASLLLNGFGKNTGFAVDFGVKYKIKNSLSLFAGFNDLGYIKWALNPLVYHNNTVLEDFYPVKQNPETKTYELNFDDFTKNGTVTPSAFTTLLNTHLNSGATWQPNKTFHSTLLLDGYLVNGELKYPGATVAGTLNGGKFSEISMNAGYSKDRPFRVGVGGSIKAGVVQLHLFSNNIIGFLNPSYMQSADIQFGLSWVWRSKKKTV